MPVDRPIFVVAPHRSGTTFLLSVLSLHEAVCSFTKAHHRFPYSPRIAAALDRFFEPDTSHEAQHVWDRFRPRDGDDRATAADVTARDRRYFPDMIGRALEVRGATRFVAKYPRLSLRIGWLDAIFPDARFVHLRRDWRAVVSSTVRRKEKRGEYTDRWFGVRIEGWRDLAGRTATEQSAEIFRVVTKQIESHAAALGPRMVRLDYETLCQEPTATLERLCDAVELDPTPLLGHPNLPRTKASFGRWQENLDPAELDRIFATDPEFFARYELEPPAGARAAGAGAHVPGGSCR